MRLGTPCVITICYTLKRGSELGLGEVEFLLNKGWLKEFKETYPNFARLNLKIVWVRPEEALREGPSFPHFSISTSQRDINLGGEKSIIG